MFYLDELYPRIFCATFHDHYHLAYTLMRFAESEESTNPRFSSPFSRDEFVEWYTKNRGSFSYSADWAGFNVRSDVMRRVIASGIPDLDRWDQLSLLIFAQCEALYPGQDYAVLGISRDNRGLPDADTLTHEMAHALYFVDEKYRDGADKLISSLRPEQQEACIQVLVDFGYSSNVWDDEIQAYLATGSVGVYPEWTAIDKIANLRKVIQKFEQHFKATMERMHFTRRLIYPIDRPLST